MFGDLRNCLLAVQELKKVENDNTNKFAERMKNKGMNTDAFEYHLGCI